MCHLPTPFGLIRLKERDRHDLCQALSRGTMTKENTYFM